MTCPDCGMWVDCGMVGIFNLMKRHCRTKKCLELKARQDKKGKGMVQGSLLTLIMPAENGFVTLHCLGERWHSNDIMFPY